MRNRVLNVLLIAALLLGMLPALWAPQPVAAADPPPNGARNSQGLQAETLELANDFAATAFEFQPSEVLYEIAGETGPAIYIIQLVDAPLASYRGGLQGLAATSPVVTGDAKLDIHTATSRAYANYLTNKRVQFLTDAGQLLGRALEVRHTYRYAYNGLAVTLTPEEAAQVVQMPGVRRVIRNFERYIETDTTPEFLDAWGIWDGTNTGVLTGTMGAGMVVGIIDTGINMDNRAFAATADDGYTHTNPRGQFYGWCNPSHPKYNPALVCNAKLIGVYSYPSSGDNPEDDNSHGSHTGSTTAGNILFNIPYEGYTFTQISGMAPRANVISYDVCVGTGCQGDSIMAAIDDATADMVDVINYSIGGGPTDPWNDPDSEAYLNARDAGVFVATSAGNSGPGAGTVGSPGNSPWMMTVGNSTIGRVIANVFDVTGPGTVPAGLTNIAAIRGPEGPAIAADIEADIIYAGDVDAANIEGCNAFPAGAFTASIAMIQRGTCNFSVKVTNAYNAGAIAVVIFNNAGGPPMVMGGLAGTAIPAVFITQNAGIAVRNWIQTETDPTARISATPSRIINADWADIMAAGSSRGPNVNADLIKPDITAPGSNIFAAYMGGPNDFGMMSGTSMASPHVAGAATLIRSLYPSWTPAEVQSALMMTSWTENLFKENGTTPADPFDLGAGRLDLTHAALTGLVLNETTTNFEDANPNTGGDPTTLNLASLANQNCVGSCSWTRTFRSVLTETVTYNAWATAPTGMDITVEPATFTLAGGATQVLTVTVDADLDVLTPGAWAFAQLHIQEATNPAPIATLLNEAFTDATFPPTGWASYKLQGGGTQIWQRVTAASNSAPASAFRRFGGSADGYQDDWLVTPQLALQDGTRLRFHDRGQYMASDYDYSGVWISTGSCNPADGAFVELREVADSLETTWRQVPTIDLSTYAGDTACLAFRYSGDFAHSWWIDDVLVEVYETTNAPLHHLPIAVRPVAATPIINVTPEALNSSQAPGEVTTQMLNIANEGGLDLTWAIAEAPTMMRLGLTLDGAANIMSSPYALILDDGVGENAIGVGGSQFLWLNRFTPTAYNFPITLDQVQVMFGYPGAPGGINVGELVDIYLYEDADGNPANGATHRASLTDQAVQAVNGTTWSTYTLAVPVTFDGPGDILIAVVNRTAGVTPGTFPAVIDQTSGSQQRSWAGFGAVPGNPPVLPLPTFGIIDSFGATFAGNWLVRGYGEGQIPCDNPADVPWLSVNPASGVTAPESDTNVTVSLDATGLTAGMYQALLCVTSNDPMTPLVEVPVALTVEATAEIEVTPATLHNSQLSNTVATDTLTIGNTGIADLEWEIEEAPGLNHRIFADWAEGFDDVTLLPGLGWAIINNSAPVGTASWFQGNPTVLPAHSGAANSYIGVNFNSTAGTGTISNWGLTPEITFNNGDILRFWTRTSAGSTFADRLQVRMSTAGASTDVGTTATSVGDFTTLLEDINPTLIGNGYPQVWTEYVITISGLSGPTNGRIGFRYFVENGGPSGANSNYIGIDTLTYTQANPCDSPADLPWLSVAPISGTTVPGDSDDVTVTFNSTGLAAGMYEGNLCVSSNDPVTPLVVVPVNMEVLSEGMFDLTILHTNDVHARVDEFAAGGAMCPSPGDASCIGGASRIATLVNQFRATTDNLLVLDAGDQFQGTLYYNLFKHEVIAEMMNAIGYDAMAVGNHEFDDGPDELANLADAVNFPILAANIEIKIYTIYLPLVMRNYSGAATAMAPPAGAQAIPGMSLIGKLHPHTIIEVGGQQVAIIGITTPDTENISSPGQNIIFHDPIATTQAQVDLLTAQGIDKIIVLTHQGYAEDLAMAAAVSGVDIIIGGHSHTFLYNPVVPQTFTPPNYSITPAGAYPTVVNSLTSEPVLVVTAFEWGRFLGRLDVTFFDGIVVNYGGNPIYVSNAVVKDPAVEALIEPYRDEVNALMTLQVGAITVDAPINVGGQQICRLGECLLGNLVTDAMLWQVNTIGGGDYQIAMTNGGGLRAALLTGPVTYGGVMQVLPFGNTIATMELKGEHLLAALEHSVRLYPAANGGFLQVSGMRYHFDPSRPAGSRIIAAEVWNGTAYVPLDPTATYKVVTNNFTRNGGDGYTWFRDHAINPYDFGPALHEAVIDYFAAFSPVTPVIEDRIVKLDQVITILHTNDTHGNWVATGYGGMVRVATLIEEQRALNPGNTILLDAGDTFQGNAYAFFFKDRPDNPISGGMNLLNYDAMVVGNHEFNFGPATFVNMLEQVNFPLVGGANVEDDGSYGLDQVDLHDYITMTVGGKDIVIYGLTNPRVPRYELPSNIPGLTFHPATVTAIADVPAIIAAEDPDLFIALNHIGYAPYGGEEDSDLRVAEAVAGIDVIIGAHSHTLLNPAVIVTSPVNPEGTLIAQAERYANWLGVVNIGFVGDEIVYRGGKLISAVGVTPHAGLQAYLDPYLAEIDAYNATPVGTTSVPIDALEAYTQETNGANLQTDAAVWALAQDGFTVDFHLSGAMANRKIAATATVANPATITKGDLFNLMPYENSLVALELNGAQLKQILERGYRNYWYYKYGASMTPPYGGLSRYTTCMLDISAGGIITYTDPGAGTPPNGNNVVAMSVNGTPITFTTDYTYTVSSVNYIVAGSCNFNDAGETIWPLDQIVYDSQIYVRDSVIDYIPTLPSPIAPAIEGRLRFQ